MCDVHLESQILGRGSGGTRARPCALLKFHRRCFYDANVSSNTFLP